MPNFEQQPNNQSAEEQFSEQAELSAEEQQIVDDFIENDNFNNLKNVDPRLHPFIIESLINTDQGRKVMSNYYKFRNFNYNHVVKMLLNTGQGEFATGDLNILKELNVDIRPKSE